MSTIFGREDDESGELNLDGGCIAMRRNSGEIQNVNVVRDMVKKVHTDCGRTVFALGGKKKVW